MRTPAGTVSPGGESAPTWVGAVQVDGRLGGTPVKGTRILKVCLGGDAVGGEDERTGVENEVAWTAPWGVRHRGHRDGARRRCTEGGTTDESARGAVGCENGAVTRASPASGQAQARA